MERYTILITKGFGWYQTNVGDTFEGAIYYKEYDMFVIPENHLSIYASDCKIINNN